VKRLLIGVVVLPLPKISDMALSANICGPADSALHNGLVNPDGKQDNPVFLAFLLKGGFDFFLNPTAPHRVVRQDGSPGVSPENLLSARSCPLAQ
jgi:hypothetical protein